MQRKAAILAYYALQSSFPAPDFEDVHQALSLPRTGAGRRKDRPDPSPAWRPNLWAKPHRLGLFRLRPRGAEPAGSDPF